MRAAGQRSKPRHAATLLAGLFALVPLLAVAAIAINTALRAYQAVDEERLRSTASALAAAVDAQLGAYLAALRTLASSPQLASDLDPTAFAMRSREVGDHFRGWVVLLGEPPGHRILMISNQLDQDSLPAELPPESRSGLSSLLTEVFEHGRPAVSDLFQGTVISRPTLTAMLPVFREHQPRRALALSFEPSELREVLSRQRLPPKTFAAVADGRLRILAHSFDPGGRSVGLSAPEWVAAAIEGKQRTLVVGPGWSGERNVYAVERLTWAPQWTVTVAEPVAAQRAGAWKGLQWLLAAAGALTLGLAIVVWASRREAVRDAREQAEALRAGRAEVERLHGGLPAIIFMRRVSQNGSGLLTYRSGDLEAVTGWPASTFIGVDSIRQWAGVDTGTFETFFRDVARNGTGTIEYAFRQPDGLFRTLRTQCRVIARQDDGSCEIAGYTRDVTAERETEARALSAARLASLGEMAGGLAHEIKQPLQSISLAAEMAQVAFHRGDRFDADNRIGHILSQTQRTADLIEHLRRFARGADEAAAPVATPLAEAIEGALHLSRSTLHQAGIRVEVAVADPPPVACAQPVLIEQVLSNLILNARDALVGLPAGATRQIQISAGPAPSGMVQLSVADTGGGIAPAVMARLFEPFVTTKGPDKGTGLGLSICHGLVKGMGGTIKARNDAEGAVFTVCLPTAPADQPVARSSALEQNPLILAHSLRR